MVWLTSTKELAASPSDGATLWSITDKSPPVKLSPALVPSALSLNFYKSSAQDPFMSATLPGETTTQSSLLQASRLDSIVTTSPLLKVLTSMVWLLTSQLLPLAHASCYTHAPTTLLALIPPLTNGRRSLRCAKKTNFTPSSTQPTRASTQVILILMPRVNVTSSNRASKWLSLNHSPRLWASTASALVPCMSCVMTKLLLIRFCPNWRSLWESTTHLPPSTVPALQPWSWTAKKWEMSGSANLSMSLREWTICAMLSKMNWRNWMSLGTGLTLLSNRVCSPSPVSMVSRLSLWLRSTPFIWLPTAVFQFAVSLPRTLTTSPPQSRTLSKISSELNLLILNFLNGWWEPKKSYMPLMPQTVPSLCQNQN